MTPPGAPIPWYSVVNQFGEVNAVFRGEERANDAATEWGPAWRVVEESTLPSDPALLADRDRLQSVNADLLGALEGMMKDAEVTKGFKGDAYQAARAAIERAKGEEK